MTQKIKPQDHPDFVGGWVWTAMEMRWIEERIAKAVLDEREACAKVCEDLDKSHWGCEVKATWCSEAIRART